MNFNQSRRFLRSLKDKRLISFFRKAGRNQQGTDTHIPILGYLIKNFEINSILELGSGFSSTPFLVEECLKSKRNISLTTIETNNDWFQKVLNKIGSHDVHKYFLWPSCASYLQENSIVNHDLIFIDDGDNYHQRRATLDAVFSSLEPGSTKYIVVHDFEVRKYNLNPPKGYTRVVFDSLKGFVGLYLPTHSYPSIKADVSRLKKDILTNYL